MKIYVSHIMEETALALSLQDWIESSFGGQCDVFLSCDKNEIPAGTEWLDQTEAVFSETILLIVLCSPSSVARPWITFETGCGWIKRVPILSLCHSRQNREELPLPFSRFPSLELEQPAFANDLLEVLAGRLGFKRAPRIDQALMQRELLNAASSAVVAAIAQGSARVTNLPQEALDILRHLVRSTDPVLSKQLAEVFQVPEQHMDSILKTLCEVSYVTRGQTLGAASTYAMNAKGRKYLSSLGLL